MTKNTDELNSGVTWVVVASADRADIYSRQKRYSQLEPVQRFDEPRARLKEQDLVSDMPGRAFDSGGQGRHAMEPDHSGKEHLRESFVHRIVETLESARGADRFQHLIIVASPAMLGALRAQLSGTTQKRVVAEIDKHMTGREPAEITSLIDADLKAIPPAVADSGRLIHLFNLPADQRVRFLRVAAWMRMNKVPLTNDRLQGQTYYACMLLNAGMKHIKRYFYREFFLDLLDHGERMAAYSGNYPRLSFGPEQRFLAKGGYVIDLRSGDAEWIVPDY